MEPVRKYEGDVWDRRQESRLNVGEPVQVKRAEKDWYYVISDATEGYARAEGIYLCTKRHYERYRDLVSREYQVVLRAGRYRDGQYLRVGTVLPLFDEEEKHVLSQGQKRISMRTGEQHGKVWDWQAEAPVLVQSYLPFTERQLRLQMERMLGIPYSWGDERADGMDCSSTVRAFYACFGLSLPRNSVEQQSCGEMLYAMNQAEYEELTGLPVDKKRERIAALGIGTVLHMPGHVMLYAGEQNGEPRIFHNCDTYRSNGEECIVRKTVISGFFPKGEGTYLDYLTAAWKPCL